MPASRTWKAFLKMRPLAMRFIRCALGNGSTASFWFDHCSELGPLLTNFGPSGHRQKGIDMTSKVAGACSANGWSIRPARSPEAENFHIMLCSISLPTNFKLPDTYKWIVNDLAMDSFSAKLIWESLRPRGQREDWTDTVWFKEHIPSLPS